MRLTPFLPALAAAAVLGAPAVASAAEVVPGKVIVRYNGDASRHERASVQQRTGTRFATRLPGGSRTLAIEDGETVAKTVADLNRHDDVAYAVPDYKVHAAGFVPNDPGRGTTLGGWQQLQWNFTGEWGVNALQAWDLARAAGAPGGRGVIVAVIDSGVAYENYRRFKRAPDLYASRFTKAKYDWVDDDRHPDDLESHGTHVTGTIAQKTNNAQGVTGLAYGVQIMPLRVLDAEGNGDGADIARAIRFAVKHGAKVINMSVEFDTSLRAGDIPEVIAALHYASRKNVTLVAASGNEGISKVAYPARDREVISVGATTFNGCLADYSNAGQGLDIVAPGGGQDAAFSSNPTDKANCDPSGADHHIYQQTLWRDVRHFKLVGFEGTSFATPHVTAAAALLIATKRLGARPTPAAIKARLKATARDLGAPGTDSHYGAGLLDVGAALAPDAEPT
ncbi:MAG: serine protease, partial [Thermoleophilaceae bacterium]|nr:serine protease [Thermoleophilaceae bacterium]